MPNIKDLFSRLNIKPKDISLYEMALTHSSCNNDENVSTRDYERIEFIGDSIIGFVSADLIYKLHEEMDQGLMSKLRSYLVCSKSLAQLARDIGLVEYIRVGHSISRDQLYKSDKILEDVFESFMGAIYLDLGLDAAYRIIKDLLYDAIEQTGIDEIVDPKTRLQEEIQAEYRDAVKYVVLDESGPAHDRNFEVAVLFNDITLGKGRGKSKKQAEEEAARDALSKRSV